MRKILFTVCFLVIATITTNAQKSDFPKLKGPYLGQKPPGNTPEIFAKEIIATDGEAQNCLTISPDGNEIFWGRWYKERSINKILTTENENGFWTKPKIADFSDNSETNDDTPFFDHNGNKLFFISKRPINSEDTSKIERIWVLHRTKKTWTNPVPFSKYLLNNSFHMQFSVSRNGTLYFHTRMGDKKNTDIYYSKYSGSDYIKPEFLSNNINSQCNEFTTFISPDESYILFARNRCPDGPGLADLFISFKNTSGDWTKPINLGETINTKFNESCPVVSPDGKYLFFNSDRSGKFEIYWVSAKIIKDLRPRE